jgi:hypothetical protein
MKQVDDKVTVKMQGIDGKDVEIQKPVSFQEVESVDDVLALAQNPDTLKDLIAAANYGFNLKARAKVTAQIKQENQGPEVSINRAVKQLVNNWAKLGNKKNRTEADARAMVLANLEAYGIDA